jgi:hypothetical protein
MVSLVATRTRSVLALQKSLKSTVNPPFTGLTQEADRLAREVASVDRAIDGLVYELYGLMEEEIKIVESK